MNESKGGIVLDTKTAKSRGGQLPSLITTYSNGGQVISVASRWAKRPSDYPVIILATINGVRRSIVGYLKASVDTDTLNTMFDVLDVVPDAHGSGIDTSGDNPRHRAIYILKG